MYDEDQIEQEWQTDETTVTPPQEGSVQFNEFVETVQRAMGRKYGWKQEYVSGAWNKRRVSYNMLLKWKQADQVPKWAVKQIGLMEFRPFQRSTKYDFWSKAEREFLETTYLENIKVKNSQLAKLCAEHFNREITENSIRGQLHRLHNNNMVPMRRPRKEYLRPTPVSAELSESEPADPGGLCG